MATFNDIVQRVKTKLQPEGIADDDFAFLVGQETFPALEELARSVAIDPKLRHHFLTNSSSVTLTLNSSGEADLSSLITNNNILIDCLCYGDIYPPVNEAYPTQPFRLIQNSGQGQLSNMTQGLILRAWLEGTTLKTISPSNNVDVLTGTISFRVPYVPTLAQVPFALEGMLVDVLTRRLSGQVTEVAANQ